MAAEEPLPEQPATQSSERKSVKKLVLLLFRFVLRLFIAILLFVYVSFGLTAAATLCKRNLYRSQGMNSLEADIGEAAENGDFRTVTAWLAARPLAETDELVKILTPKSASLGANVFFEIARREVALGRTEEALFWLELGRFRLLYDIIRCGAEPETTSVFDTAFKRMHTPETDALLWTHPELIKKTAQRVLDFDDKYPAHDNPAFICKAVLSSAQLPAEEVDWEGYRQLLRQHTARFLKTPDKAKAAAGKK